MTRHAIIILAGALVLFPGCTATRTQSQQRAPVAAEQAKLLPGETIRLESKATIDAGSREASIDAAGDVCFLLGVKVHVGGLTPAEATVAVQKTYQPKYFRNWDFEVIRVQRDGSANRSQPVGPETNRTLSAAGSGR